MNGFLSYEWCKERATRRKHKVFGWRVYGSWAWMFYDAKNDEYQVYVRKWGNGHQDPVTKRWVPGPPEQRITSPFLIIKNDDTTIFDWKEKMCGISSLMKLAFGLYCFTPRSKKYDPKKAKGYSYARTGKWYNFKYEDALIAEGPVVIGPGRRVHALGPPPKIRTFNEERRQELNRLIFKVRRQLKIRHNMGGFDGFDASKVYEHMNTRPTLLQCLQKFDVLKLNTFNPLIEHILTHLYPHYYFHPNYGRYMKQVDMSGLGKGFDMMIRSKKETLLQEFGVVSYV